MSDQLKLGFIGGGTNSAVGRAHVVSSQMDGRWKLVAGAFSRDQSVNKGSAAAWGVDNDRTHASWTDLIEREAGRLDAVVVLTPTPEHPEQVAALLRAGFDVICEKALAATSAEADELADLAESLGRFLAVTYNYSGYPMVRELRSRVNEGQFGRILAANVEMPQEGFLRVDATGNPMQPQLWRRSDGALPTVSLDLGTHTHQLLHFLIGSDPVKLVGTESHHGRIDGVVDYVSSLIRYEDNVDVNMWYGKCAIGHRNGLRIRVYGSDAAAEWSQASPEELRLSDHHAAISVVDRASPATTVANQPRYERFKVGHPAGFLEAFANLYWDFADALLESRVSGSWSTPYVYGAREAADGLRMLEAISTSSRDGVWVSMRHPR